MLSTQIFAHVDVQFDNVYWLITELCLCFFDTDLIDLSQGSNFFTYNYLQFYVVSDTNFFVLFFFFKKVKSVKYARDPSSSHAPRWQVVTRRDLSKDPECKQLPNKEPHKVSLTENSINIEYN